MEDSSTGVEPHIGTERNAVELYEPLDKPQQSIRLLEILSASDQDGIIQCTLKPVSLGEKPSYIALSYMWGDATDTQDIIVNGHLTPVTRSLQSVLLEIRSVILPLAGTTQESTVIPSRVWADAICINQRDIQEQNDQVQQMGAIYSGATIVMSWPGTEIKDINLAITALEIFEKEMKHNVESIEDIQWLQRYPSIFASDTYEISAAVQALSNIFLEPYWTRAWVLQEIMLAKNHWILLPGFLIGHRMLTSLLNLQQWLSKTTSSRPDFISYPTWSSLSRLTWTSQLDEIHRIRKQQSSSYLMPWTSIFTSHTWFRRQATDARDNVFAFQAICGNQIMPDYARSVGEVYHQLAQSWISTRIPLERLLCYAGEGESFASKFGISSWVPDWQRLSQLERPKFAMLRRRFSANVGLEGWDEVPAVIEQHRLRVSGCLCDRVVKIEYGYEPTLMETFKFWDKYSKEHARVEKQHPTRLPFLHVLLRTLLLDRFPRHEDDPGTPQFHDLATQTELLHAHYFLRSGNGFDGDGFVEEFLGEVLLGEVLGGVPMHPSLRDGKFIDRLFTEGPRYNTILRVQDTIQHRLFHTEEGYLGVGPRGMRAGDLLYVLAQSRLPVLLREEGGHHVLVGVCIVVGFMYGETARLVEEGKLVMKELEIF